MEAIVKSFHPVVYLGVIAVRIRSACVQVRREKSWRIPFISVGTSWTRQIVRSLIHFVDVLGDNAVNKADVWIVHST